MILPNGPLALVHCIYLVRPHVEENTPLRFKREATPERRQPYVSQTTSTELMDSSRGLVRRSVGIEANIEEYDEPDVRRGSGVYGDPKSDE